MSEVISRWRRTRREKKAQTEARPKKKFKDSVWLAAIYEAVFALLATGLGYLLVGVYRGSIGPLRFSAPSWNAACAVLAGAVLFVAGFRETLRGLTPEIFRRNSRLCLAYVIVFLALAYMLLWYIGAHCLVDRFGGDRFDDACLQALPLMLPYFFAPAALTLLLGPMVGLSAGVGIAVFVGILSVVCGGWGDAGAEFTPEAVGSLVGGFLNAAFVPRILSLRRIRRRTRLVQLALLMSVLNFVILLISWSFTWKFATFRDDGVLVRLGLGLVFLAVSGMIHAVAVAVALPPLEHFFAVTSDIALNNFADLAHPLLERLSLEAPGTYNHSTLVAQLAAAAADRIGANPILARVGAYYHDIGKLSKPLFFTENQTEGTAKPLDSLKPSTSASWIRSHVKEGIVLADKHRLPPSVRKMIWEHHGTTTIVFFLGKARQQAKEEAEKAGGRPLEEVDESTFRYDGPKPSTKESGILMLADSVEAATRSLVKPSPSSIESLVQDICAKKILDGQFDECPLTLEDFAVIRKVFVERLLAILHARIAYPKEEPEPKAQKEPEALPAEGRGTPAAGANPREPEAAP